MDPNNDPKQESPEAKKARLEQEASKASEEYKAKKEESEKKAGSKLQQLFSKETLAKAALLEGLDLVPFFAGYSVADFIVAAEAIADLIYAWKNKDTNAALRGTAKLAIAGVPGVPVSGAAPALDVLLPNQEKEAQPPKPTQETAPVNNQS